MLRKQTTVTAKWYTTIFLSTMPSKKVLNFDNILANSTKQPEFSCWYILHSSYNPDLASCVFLDFPEAVNVFKESVTLVSKAGIKTSAYGFKDSTTLLI